MTASLLHLTSGLLVAAGVLVYAVGLWRRWRPKDGKPGWMSDPSRFKEPWTAAAFGLVIMAVLLQGLARMFAG